MDTYFIKWRRRGVFRCWRKLRIAGHKYNAEQDKMVLVMPDGGLRELREWTSCEIRLGYDWVDFTRRAMERESGQSIPLNINKGH